jgi:hypothetical protein
MRSMPRCRRFIVGREVLTILAPRCRDNQRWTARFRYLMQVGGRIVRVAASTEEHVAQLGSALRRLPTDEHPHLAAAARERQADDR